MSGRVFLADQSLTSFGGHCHAYFAPIRDALAVRGIKAMILGHRTIEATLVADGVEAVFSLLSDDRAAGGLSSAAVSVGDAIRNVHEAAMRADLRASDARHRFGAEDIIVFNTVRHWPLRAFPRWLEELDEARRPRLALIFHHTSRPDPFRPNDGETIYREGFTALERSPARDRITLATDASTLIDEFREFTTLPVILAPFPHTTRSRGQHHSDGKLSIGYAGEARREKGFHLLPGLAERMLDTELADKVQFQIQSFIGNPNQSFFRDADQLLRRLENVTVHAGAMTPTAYERFLQSANVLLIPYERTFYHRQTSGIFAEARGMDIPVIVTRGTWMAKELLGAGGGVLCQPDDPVSLFDAVQELCSNYPRFLVEAQAAGLRWRATNSIERLFEVFRI